MEVNLKPCPFCGYAARAISPLPNPRGSEPLARCSNDKLCAGATISAFVTEWNTRASSPTPSSAEAQDSGTALTDAEVDAFLDKYEETPSDNEAKWRVALRMYQKTYDDLVSLRQRVEDTVIVAKTDVDAEDTITAYHFKTGAIHRLLAEARKGDGPITEDYKTIKNLSANETAEKIVQAVWRHVRRYDDGDIWMDTLRAAAAVRCLLAISTPQPTLQQVIEKVKELRDVVEARKYDDTNSSHSLTQRGEVHAYNTAFAALTALGAGGGEADDGNDRLWCGGCNRYIDDEHPCVCQPKEHEPK